MNESKTITRLFWIIAAAVALIAAGSFVWSFLALWELAGANSSQPALGWIWPLITDLSMVIYTGAILVAQLQRRPARLPIGLTVFYALVTIAGNVLHAPVTPLGWFVAILPPLSLVFGTEMLRSMGHHMIERAAAVQTLGELLGQSDQARADLARLLSQSEAAGVKLESLKSELKQAHFQQKNASIEEMNAAKLALIERRRADVLTLLSQGKTAPAIADELQVSVSTVKRDITALNGAAILTRGVTL